jgi:hypothetical protein
MLKHRFQSAGGQVGDFFCRRDPIGAAEEKERACFGAFFSIVHQKIIRGFFFKLHGAKKSSLLCY